MFSVTVTFLKVPSGLRNTEGTNLLEYYYGKVTDIYQHDLVA